MYSWLRSSLGKALSTEDGKRIFCVLLPSAALNQEGILQIIGRRLKKKNQSSFCWHELSHIFIAKPLTQARSFFFSLWSSLSDSPHWWVTRCFHLVPCFCFPSCNYIHFEYQPVLTCLKSKENHWTCIAFCSIIFYGPYNIKSFLKIIKTTHPKFLE